MNELNMALIGQLVAGPGLFVLGAFFVMLPFTAVRVFGVTLTAYAAVSGSLSADVMSPAALFWAGMLALLAVGLGAYANYRLTTRRINQLIQQSKERARSGGQLLVPYAKDGSWFHPGLVYADGRYRVGPKGSEQVVGVYSDALHYLREMPVACWRRPSPKSGLLGMVSAAHWSQPPETTQRHLMRSTRETST